MGQEWVHCFLGILRFADGAAQHAVLNTPSVCSFKVIAAYWKNGTLPAPGAVCEAAPAFDGYSWANVIKETGAAGPQSIEKRAVYGRGLR